MTIQQVNQFYRERDDRFTLPEEVSKVAFDGRTSKVNYIAISGTAGRTATAAMTAAILKEANFRVGRYEVGRTPLSKRLWVDGCSLSETVLSEVTEKLASHTELSQLAAELAAACRSFEREGCAFAVLEMSDAGLADSLPQMPVCAVTHIGADGNGHSKERLARLAADVMREDAICITAPNQDKAALSELIVAAGTHSCELIVPDKDDISFLEAIGSGSHINYGGYETELAFLGNHAACNAAMAVELALALWRKGFVIEDEAILKGLAAAQNTDSVLLVQNRPLILLDSCHTPEQAEALTAVLRTAKLEHLSAIIAMQTLDGAEEFFKTLETGFLTEEEKTKKNQMSGMADNPFDTVYLVDGGVSADELREIAKFHFDVFLCSDVAEAMEEAREEENTGMVICGCQEIVQEAKNALHPHRF